MPYSFRTIKFLQFAFDVKYPIFFLAFIFLMWCGQCDKCWTAVTNLDWIAGFRVYMTKGVKINVRASMNSLHPTKVRHTQVGGTTITTTTL